MAIGYFCGSSRPAAKESPLLQQVFQEVAAREGLDNLTKTERQANVLRHICDCRTVRSVPIKVECPTCGYNTYHYASCNDSCCPLCGESKRTAWVVNESDYILDCSYYHIVFTVPSELNPYFLLAPKEMYNILFKVASATLKELGKDSAYLGAEQMGFMMMLHSFGSNLSYHPHIHCLCAGCGLDKDKRLVFPKKKSFLFPVKVVAKKFRGKFLDTMKKNFPMERLEDKDKFYSTINKCWTLKWNIELRDRTTNKDAVMEYLGRYINRTAISCSRVKEYDKEKGQVTFEWKDYRDNGKKKMMTLNDTEFVRRFIMHIPPSGFIKLRFYGFWGNRGRYERFKQLDQHFARIALSRGESYKIKERRKEKATVAEALQIYSSRKGKKAHNYGVCPKCNTELWFIRLE